MKINVTCTLNYDSHVMDEDNLTDEQFYELVKEYALADFNGGVSFDPINMDFEIK